jgi:hypothetical protein
MPLETKHYKLEAFTWGDTYSSQIDRRRFIIMDNQLEFLSNMVGDGLISGWDITNNGDGTVSISPGIGIIDKRVVESFGNYEVILSNNTIHYVYMKARQGEVGAISGNSNIISLIGVDNTPPAAPINIQRETSITSYLTGLSSYDDDFINYIKILLDRRTEDATIELTSYKEIAFSWDANTESDFSYYQITRIDGSDIDILGTTTETFYADINLIHNHTYTYQISAFDLSNNESAYSEIEITTDIDTRIPSPPLYVQVFPSDGTLEVIWDHSPTGNVESYEIIIQPLDNYYNNDGTSTSTIVDAVAEEEFGSTYAIFENLENNKYYDITIYAIPVGGSSYKSDGVTVRTFLEVLAGAGEVNDINITFAISSFENVGIETTLEWRYHQNDPYLPIANKFIITVIERGVRFSEPIEVLASTSERPGGCSDGNNDEGQCHVLEIKYIPYRINGILQYESIKEYTPYIFIIKTEDEEGNNSNGILVRVNRTPVSEILSPVTNFFIERKADNSIFLSWTNPVELYFNYNLITINIIDLGSGDIDGTLYVENLRVDRSETYTIPSDQFNINYRYDVTIIPYDIFGTSGTDYNHSTQFTAEEIAIRPSIPANLQINSGDTQVYLKWDKDLSEEQEIAFYKIYRAEFQFYVMATDFTNIAIVPSIYDRFIDYTVTNGIVYTYFITAVDIYGNESLNPAEDGHIPSGLISGNPTENTSLSPPTGLDGNANSNNADAELSWIATSGTFDGYQILRSDENNYSFVVVGNAPVSQTVYIDSDALLKDEAYYYYLVRKYKNETDVTVTSSSVVPTASLLIGIITTTNGFNNVNIDISSVVHILNFEDPLINKTNAALSIHHHTNDGGLDKRIELRSNIHVTDWITNDYITYSTEEDIEGGTSYFLTINGTLNEDYFITDGITDVARLSQARAGESPVIYEVDGTNGKIVFNGALYSLENSFSAPYLSSPSLSLEVLGISEVDNYLPSINVGNVSATQFDSGQIDSRQMPSVHHQGRKGERLLPLRLPMQTLDNFVYSLAATYDNEDRNKMGEAVTFYDIINIDADRLLAATSNGIWLSDNYGNDWDQVKTFSTAIHRLYKSIDGEYYAVTNYGVYKNNGTSFQIWDSMGGLEYVKVIRDITEDNSGNLYISTDLGVFRLNSENVPYIENTWEKLSIFGPRSSETYALFYDGDYFDSASTGRLLASNELGLLQSIDEGRSWSYILELEPNIKVWRFLKDNNYIFALSDTALYREEVGTNIFIKIAEIDASISRKIQIYNSVIYIATDKGPQSSVSSDIYTDTDIDFISEWALVNINNNIVIVTSINKIGDELFVGTDRRLYILKGQDFWIQFEEKNTVIPTFYSNSILQKMGYYYNNGGTSQNVSFDESINSEYTIEVCNKYDIYFAEYGGWAQNKYNAKFIIYDNDSEFGESRDEIELDTSPFVNIVLPTYDDNNSHKLQADIYKTQIESDLEQITAITPLEGEPLVTLIVNTYKDFELFLSQLYEEARVITDSDGNTINFVLPEISTDLIVKRSIISNMGISTEIEEPVYTTINEDRDTSYTVSVNVVNGMFIFGIPFDKYDNLTLDIHDVTVKNVGTYGHRDIEDIFEYIYSGPTSYLSQVQQANIVKMSLFGERYWPGQQELYTTPVQMRTFVPTDDIWYDTLNSTINYEVQNENTGLSLSLFYPSRTIFSTNIGNVLVGGQGGVLSIDINSLNITEINFSSISDQMVRDIYEYGNNIYILTDKNIYISSNGGGSWSEYNKNGLPNQLYSIGSIYNNLIIGASDGIYIKLSDSESIDWEKVKDSIVPVTIMHSSNILFAVIDGNIHTTSNGFTYSNTNIGSDLDITNIDRYGYTHTYVSSNQGLYSDNGTFNSLSPSLEEVDLGELIDNTNIVTVNDIATNDEDKIVIGLSNGTYGIIMNDVLNIKESTSLDSIHKVLFVNDDIWLFGHDVFKVPTLDYPIKLSAGSPV